MMVSYSSWNGVKMHANRDLVTGLLKNTLKFKVWFANYPFSLSAFFPFTLIMCLRFRD